MNIKKNLANKISTIAFNKAIKNADAGCVWFMHQEKVSDEILAKLKRK